MEPAGRSRRVFFWREREVSARVGVFGATGYTGRELVRLLRRHPRARVSFTTGSDTGHLAHEAGLDQAADAYFLAMPHGIAATYAARLREARPEAIVVDLSGDLRLPPPRATSSGTATTTRPRTSSARRSSACARRTGIAFAAPGSSRTRGATPRRSSCPSSRFSARASSTRPTSSRTPRAAPPAPAARRARTSSSARSPRTSRPTRRAARTGTWARSRRFSPTAPASASS